MTDPAPDFVVVNVSGVGGYVVCAGDTTDQMHQDADEYCGYIPRVCTVHQNWEYIHVVQSDLGLQVEAGAPNIAIQSLHSSIYR